MIVFVSLVMRMKRSTKNSSKVQGSGNSKRRRSLDKQDSSKSNEGDISLRSQEAMEKEKQASLGKDENFNETRITTLSITDDSDESQQDEKKRLTEKENQRWDQLEEGEKRSLQAAQPNEHEAETENVVKTNVNNQRLETETEAIKRKQGQEISVCFEAAKQKLGRLLKSKKQVIRDLACELERLGRPVDHIAAEIVHELRECEELSKSLIYSYLDEKYKDPSHASRRKGKKAKNLVPETGTESATEEDQAGLAAEQEAQLKPEVLVQADTSGHSIQQKQPTAEAEKEQQSYHSTETGINIHPDTTAFKPDSATIAQQEEETASRPQPRCGIDSVVQEPVCKHCPAKDAKIMELEEAVRALTSIKSVEELIHRSTDGYQQFEFSMPFEPLRRHMVYFNGINGPLPDSVWFNGKFNRTTGKVVDVQIGRTTDTDATDTSRMTP
jgi:hypothetical protein